MKILVTGASGMIGKALVPHLFKQGHQISRLWRKSSVPGELSWDPAHGALDGKIVEGFDGVIHLAGENIAASRWTAARKKRLRDSRVEVTQLLAEALAAAKSPPRWFIGASASGYYGDRGEEKLTETSEPGKGFLAELCQAWEAATAPLEKKGVKVAHLRMGIVLDREGGALARMLPPFRLGLGGRLGSGRQYMPWIRLDEVLTVVDHVIKKGLSGPVNAVAPETVTNAQFTAALGKILDRPAVLPVPGVALKLLMGEMAEELLLSGARVEPAVLAKTGYAFKHPRLEDALRGLLRGR